MFIGTVCVRRCSRSPFWSNDPETAVGKVLTGNGNRKPETGNRKPPRQGAAAGYSQPKPETGNRKPEAEMVKNGEKNVKNVDK